MENLNIVSNKKFTMDKFLTQHKITVENNIKKILKITPNSKIITKDCANGIVSVSGKVSINVLYLSEENNIESIDVIFDFIEKQQSKFELTDLFALDNVSVSDANFSGLDVVVGLDHNVEISGLYAYTMEGDFESDDLVLNKTSFSSLKLNSSVEESFVVAEEYESSLKDVKVLSSTAKALAIDVYAGVDKIVVEGQILANVTYLENGAISLLQKAFEFKQEMASNGVVPNMITNANIDVMNIMVTPEEKDDKTTLVFAIDMFAKGYAFEEVSQELVVDMFSLKNKISTTLEYVESKNYVESRIVNSNFEIEHDVSKIENLDDILGVFEPYYKYDSIEYNDESIIIKGFVHFFVIYKANDDIYQMELNEPFQEEIARENSNTIKDISSLLEIVSSKVKAGKMLEINFNLKMNVEYQKSVSGKFIKNYELKEERKAENSGITVYVAGQGDNLFEIAKAVGVRPEIIKEQNESLETINAGEKIYIYSPANLC